MPMVSPARASLPVTSLSSRLGSDVTARVVVGEDYRRGARVYGGLEDLPGMDQGGGEGADRDGGARYHGVLRVQKDDHEALAVEMGHPAPKQGVHVRGPRDHGPPRTRLRDHPLAELGRHQERRGLRLAQPDGAHDLVYGGSQQAVEAAALRDRPAGKLQRSRLGGAREGR